MTSLQTAIGIEGRKAELDMAVYGQAFFAIIRFALMQLITILNRCNRFRGFVYNRARFAPDRSSIEILVRPRKGSGAVCSRCHQHARGGDASCAENTLSKRRNRCGNEST
jgi:hypothetical protein